MNLINMSEGAFLAIHSLAIIVRNQPVRMRVKELAEDLKASVATLAKVFQKLSKAGLVNSVRGPAGGFELNKAAEEITFLQIYEVFEGVVKQNECPLGKDECAFKSCIFDDELNIISSEIYEALKNRKLSDIC